MDYQKIDAALAAALKDVRDPEERVLGVFIHVAPAFGPAEAAFLERLGVSGVTAGRQVFTATLSARAVAELSDQPWVQYLRLSRKLRLLSPDFSS
jgi:hypothetical protein